MFVVSFLFYIKTEDKNGSWNMYSKLIAKNIGEQDEYSYVAFYEDVTSIKRNKIFGMLTRMKGLFFKIISNI